MYVCVYMYMCMYIYIYLCVCIRAHVHVYAYTNIWIHICIYIHIYVHTCLYIYINVHIYTYIYKHTNTYIFAYLLTHTHTQICINVNIYRNIGHIIILIVLWFDCLFFGLMLLTVHILPQDFLPWQFLRARPQNFWAWLPTLLQPLFRRAQ